MREEGIDLSNARPRKLTAELPRKPPIAQHRLRQTDRDLVTFETKDTRTKRIVETRYATADFLAALAHHILDRYSHNARYFGLLAPRSKAAHAWSEAGANLF
jgi:putative transposase